MVKIPNYEQQGDFRPSGRIVQGVRTPADDGIARGVQKLGQATLEVAGRIQQANLDQELVKAETDLRVRMDKARQAIELDPETPDVAIPKRWQQESEAIIGEIGGTISSGRARELWTIRARGLQAEGDTWSVNLQRKRQVDGVRAGFVAMASEAEAQAGDMSISEETYAAKVDALRALNDTQVAGGFVDKEEGARRQAVLENLALKDRTMRWSANIDALVKAGRMAEAEEVFSVGAARVDPATRQRMREGLDASKQEYAAVEQRDAIWAEAKGDYGKALQLAGRIKDAPLRLKVEAGLNQKLAQTEAARQQGKETAQRSLWGHMLAGGTIANAPPSVLAATEGAIDFARAYENARDREAGMDAATLKEFTLYSSRVRNMLESGVTMPPNVFMSDPSSWRSDHRQFFESLSAADQTAIHEKRENMRDKGTDVTEVDRVEKALWSEIMRIAPKSWRLDDTRTDSAMKVELTSVIRQQATKVAQDMGGAPIKLDDIRAYAALALGQTNEGMKLDYTRWNKFSSNFRPDASGAYPYDRDPADWAAAEQIATQWYGPNATIEQIGEAYRKLRGEE